MVGVSANRGEAAEFGAPLEVEDLVNVQAPSDDDAGSGLSGVPTVAVAGCAYGEACPRQPG